MRHDLNASYALANDIDASDDSGLNGGKGFETVGNSSDFYYDNTQHKQVFPHSFGGTFDGKGHAITHLRAGLFGLTSESASISDLMLSIGDAVGTAWFGLVGRNRGAISGCSVSGSIKVGNGGGGLVGFNSGTVSDCHSSMNVQGGMNASGLVGINDGTGRIDACSFSGTIVSDSQEVGGVCGENGGEISDCYNTGSVRGRSRTGGIVGRTGGTVSGCFNTGKVSGDYMIGGVAGDNIRNISRCFNTGSITGKNLTGGIAGWNNGRGSSQATSSGTISECANIGPVAGDLNTGGIAGGDQGAIVNCYNQADVLAGNRTGGFIGQYGPLPGGWGSYPCDITNCYSAGRVGGGTDVGGFIGWRSDEAGNLSSCYYDNESAAINDAAGATGKDRDEMMKKATFVGWDFDLIWNILEDVSYPTLRAVNVNATGINHNPIISTQPVTWASAGSVYSVQYSASDRDKDPLTWSLTTNASWLTMSVSGLLSGKPSITDLGVYSVIIAVSDGKGGSASQMFELSVTANRQPEILSVNAPDEVTVPASKALSFSVDASDPDGDALSYEWQENGVSLSNERSFSRKFAPGNHTLILLIGDGRYITTRTFNFTVAPPPKTIDTRPAPIPAFEAGVVAAAAVTAVAIGLFWRRERR